MCDVQESNNDSDSSNVDRLTEDESKFGLNVRDARKAQGISQRALAERLAEVGLTIDASAITRLEKGSRAIRLGEALAIAEALSTDLEELLGPDPKRRMEMLRAEANRHMNESRWALREFLDQLLEIRDLLNMDDDLIADVTAADYFSWVKERVSGIAAAHSLSLFVNARRDANALQAIANALVKDVVVVHGTEAARVEHREAP